MKLCYLCNEYPPGPHGGIGTLTRTLAHMMARAGHEVSVIGYYPDSWPGPDLFPDDGVRVIRIRGETSKLRWIGLRHRLCQEVRRMAARSELDLLEAPDYQGWTAGWQHVGVPVVIRLSGTVTYFQNETGAPGRRLTSWLERTALRASDVWCSESAYLARRTMELFSLKPAILRVIYNPVETPEDPGLPRDRTRVVFAGTLTEKKGVDTLLRVWPAVLNACPTASLDIYGRDTTRSDGTSMERTLRALMPHEVLRSVRFKGHVPLEQLHRAFWGALVAALPSVAEGFALTPLHAMGCGCATICANRNSGPELVQPGVNGLLVDPRDPAALAEAVITCLRDPVRAAAMGRRARQRVAQDFSPEAVANANQTLYTEAIDRYAKRSRRGFSRSAAAGGRND